MTDHVGHESSNERTGRVPRDVAPAGSLPSAGAHAFEVVCASLVIDEWGDSKATAPQGTRTTAMFRSKDHRVQLEFETERQDWKLGGKYVLKLTAVPVGSNDCRYLQTRGEPCAHEECTVRPIEENPHFDATTFVGPYHGPTVRLDAKEDGLWLHLSPAKGGSKSASWNLQAVCGESRGIVWMAVKEAWNWLMLHEHGAVAARQVDAPPGVVAVASPRSECRAAIGNPCISSDCPGLVCTGETCKGQGRWHRGQRWMECAACTKARNHG